MFEAITTTPGSTGAIHFYGTAEECADHAEDMFAATGANTAIAPCSSTILTR